MSQVIGFTAASPLQALTAAPGPVASKIVDNSGHKWNACLVMHISPAALNTEISEIASLAPVMTYNITTYNCVDFALQVINAVRGTDPLKIPKYQIPGQPLSMSSTPEGFYLMLESMQEAGGPESRNIITDAVAYAPPGKGPCN